MRPQEALEWEEHFWTALTGRPEGGDCCAAGSTCLSLWCRTLHLKALKTLCLGLSTLVFYSVLWHFYVSRVYSLQNGQTLRLMILYTHQWLTPFCFMESSLNCFILVGKNNSFENINSTVIIHGRHSSWRHHFECKIHLLGFFPSLSSLISCTKPF